MLIILLTSKLRYSQEFRRNSICERRQIVRPIRKLPYASKQSSVMHHQSTKQTEKKKKREKDPTDTQRRIATLITVEHRRA